MPGLHTFVTAVERRDAGDHRVRLQVPLASDATRTDVGWLTRIVLVGDPFGVALSRPIAKVRRITTSVRHTPNGLRRVFKDQPYTTERLVVYPARVVSTTSTSWGWRWTSAATTTDRLSFSLADLAPLLRGVIATGEGQPLVDWLVENAAEFAPFVSRPGWLPSTIEEFEAVRRRREEEAFEDEEEDVEDRWR